MLLGVLASCKKKEPIPDADSETEQDVSADESQGEGTEDGDDTPSGDDGNPNPPDKDNDDDGGKPEYSTVETTVMTFNIRYQTDGDEGVKNWENRKAAVFEYINGQDASIVCMQEVNPTQQADLRLNITERFDMIWYGRGGAGSEGLAIAYDKSTWSLLEQDCFWLSETPDVKSYGWGASKYRICVTALLEHNVTGAKMKVFNTHLDLSATPRVNGLKVIMSRIAQCEYPVYLCGDFNDTPNSEAYAVAAETLQDAQITAPDSDEGSTFTGWGTKTDADKYVIDFCFFSKESIEPLTYEICDDRWGENNENMLSDHNAIKVKVKLRYKAEELPDISGLIGSNGSDGVYS